MAYSLCLIPVDDTEIAGATKSPAPGRALERAPCCSNPRRFIFHGRVIFLCPSIPFIALFPLLISKQNFDVRGWLGLLSTLRLFLFILGKVLVVQGKVLHASSLLLGCAGTKILFTALRLRRRPDLTT